MLLRDMALTMWLAWISIQSSECGRYTPHLTLVVSQRQLVSHNLETGLLFRGTFLNCSFISKCGRISTYILSILSGRPSASPAIYHLFSNASRSTIYTKLFKARVGDRHETTPYVFYYTSGHSRKPAMTPNQPEMTKWQLNC